MKFLNWKIWLSISLLALSASLYSLNYLIFHDVNYMARLFLAQLGFLPISVLLVTIIINQLLTQHARRAKMAKLNMVIGAFFSEVGLPLLKILSSYDLHRENFRQDLKPIGGWSDQEFLRFKHRLTQDDFPMEVGGADLAGLRNFLVDKRDFLLRLLENPNLLEHDSFSTLLWAVFHLTEELAQRPDLQRLHPADRAHLGEDMRRAYTALLAEWLTYMAHLKNHYPYLFSLALRTNPFDPQATSEIK